jgi:hypothetical protein
MDYATFAGTGIVSETGEMRVSQRNSKIIGVDYID